MKTKLAKVFRIKGQSALLRYFDESIENDVFFSDAEILKAIKESIEDVEAGREKTGRVPGIPRDGGYPGRLPRAIPAPYHAIRSIGRWQIGDPLRTYAWGAARHERQTRVVTTAEAYKAKLAEAGTRGDLILYPEQPHGFFNRGEWFTKTFRDTDVFLKSLGYIQGEPGL